MAGDPQRLHAWGFSRYKRPLLRQFCWEFEVIFIDDLGRLPRRAILVLWGSTTPPGLQDAVAGSDVEVWRVEDGFLRSVGLGAEGVRPLSWVIDREGIYYDSRTASSLEQLCQSRVFDERLIDRAASLRRRIVEGRLTKYNVGSQPWRRSRTDRPVLLVPGQVPGDASLRYGSPDLQSNLALLASVRASHPDAHIVYKPHPDVLAGLRHADGEREGDEVKTWCDEVLGDTPMADVLDQVDAVHTLTSLAGFEALLRGKPVHCHGQPFYAGWGLTQDRTRPPRRTRRLTLDELVAATLIEYPRYVGQHDRQPSTPETALDELLAWQAGVGSHPPLWRRVARRALRWSRTR